MDYRWTALLTLLALASSASAWSDLVDQYFCEEVVTAVWGTGVASNCLTTYGAEEQNAFCALAGDKMQACSAVSNLVSPAVLPNRFGDGELEQRQDCPITDMIPASYLCTKKTDASDKAKYWMGQAISSEDACQRIQLFCVAANYMAQSFNPFDNLLMEDPVCKELAYRRIDMALKNNQTMWAATQECNFSYSMDVAGGSIPKTYVQKVSIDNKRLEAVVKNLTAEARGIKNMRFATTTTTTTTLAKHVEDIVPQDIQLACNIDSDCAQVNADCCGCNAGGKAISIRRNYIESWSNDLAGRCAGTVCLTVMSRHISCFSQPACVQKKCVLKPDTSRLCGSGDIKLDCMGAVPTQTPGESRDYGVSCGYINYVCQKQWSPATTTTATTMPPVPSTLQATTTQPTRPTVPPTTIEATTTTQPQKGSASTAILYVVGAVILIIGVYVLYTMLQGPKEKDERHYKKGGLGGLSGRETRIESYGSSRLTEADKAPRTKEFIPLKDRVEKKEHAPEPAPKKKEEKADDKGKIKSLLKERGRDDTTLGRR
jgi:hypothetical protein